MSAVGLWPPAAPIVTRSCGGSVAVGLLGAVVSNQSKIFPNHRFELVVQVGPITIPEAFVPICDMLRNASGRAGWVGAARGLVRRTFASEAKGSDAVPPGAAVDNLAKFEQQRQATAQDEARRTWTSDIVHFM